MGIFNLGRIVVVLMFFAVGHASAGSQSSDVAELAVNTDIQLNGAGSSIIVEYKSTTSFASLGESSKKAFVQSMHQNFIKSLSISTAQMVSSSFDYVPAMVMTVNQDQLNEVLKNPLVKSVYPNKARRINLQESLGIVLPGGSKERYSGKGQTIAILDTGVDRSHSFFTTNNQNRIVSEACYSGGGLSGFDEVGLICPNRGREQTGTGAGNDCTNFGYPGCDHGTHVAGIAAGNDGVANEANIIAVQVFTGIRDVFRRDVCGTGVGQSCVVAFDSDIINGLERVFALRNAYNIAAVNMSLGGGQFFGSCNAENSAMTNIIGQLKSAGIATISSSGNSGFSNSIGYPSCISNVIAVGATSDFTGTLFGQPVTTDQRVFYSNHSSSVDLMAPGTLIRSSIPGNRFSDFNGTSMAAPHVAGGFAVVKAQNNQLTVNAIENAFKSVGPVVSHAGVNRRRIDIASTLRKLGLFSSGVTIPTMLLLLDDEPITEPPAGCSLKAIGLGEGKTDSWTSVSPLSSNRSPALSETFVFELTQTRIVTINLSSLTVDTYLYLMEGCNTSGQVIEFDDDSGNGLNSRINVSLEAGVYTIDATTYNTEGAQGTFYITLN